MNESFNISPIPRDPENPEDAFLDSANIPADVLARLEAADRAAEQARKPGLSTLTPEAQQSLIDQITKGGADPIVDALKSQTQREIAEGIFDLDSLSPELRELLVSKSDNDVAPQGDL
jgi:hypothetical protein